MDFSLTANGSSRDTMTKRVRPENGTFAMHNSSNNIASRFQHQSSLNEPYLNRAVSLQAHAQTKTPFSIPPIHLVIISMSLHLATSSNFSSVPDSRSLDTNIILRTYFAHLLALPSHSSILPAIPSKVTQANFPFLSFPFRSRSRSRF